MLQLAGHRELVDDVVDVVVPRRPGTRGSPRSAVDSIQARATRWQTARPTVARAPTPGPAGPGPAAGWPAAATSAAVTTSPQTSEPGRPWQHAVHQPARRGRRPGRLPHPRRDPRRAPPARGRTARTRRNPGNRSPTSTDRTQARTLAERAAGADQRGDVGDQHDGDARRRHEAPFDRPPSRPRAAHRPGSPGHLRTPSLWTSAPAHSKPVRLGIRHGQDGVAPSSRVSVVVPVYNEAEVLPLLVARLRPVARRPRRAPTRSSPSTTAARDATPVLLQRFRREWPELRVVRLRANAGHQAAISAGHGRAPAATRSSPSTPTCRTRPRSSPEMLAAARADGVDVVYGVRTDRSSDSAFKRLSARGFYRADPALSRTSGPKDAGDYRLMSRATVDAVDLPARSTTRCCGSSCRRWASRAARSATARDHGPPATRSTRSRGCSG